MVDKFSAMLEYEWGNPSAVILSGDDPSQDSGLPRQILDPYAPATNESLIYPTGFPHNQYLHPPAQPHLQPSLYDPRAFDGACSYSHTSPAVLSLDPGGHSAGFIVVPKSEPGCGGCGGVEDFAATIGLNLGGRTYFSVSDDDFVNRLYRRSRAGEPIGVNAPRCQAEGCNADLSHAKHYHRRHKVCEFHSKATTVITAGLTQRFCQQCSRFHLLSEFDNGKRSCRKRLADHNRRRRKSHQQASQDDHKSPLQNARHSSSDSFVRSPADSGAQSSSSVTVAISPPRMSLDCFGRQQSSSSASTSSLIFFSNG